MPRKNVRKERDLFSERDSLTIVGRVAEILSPNDLFNSLTRVLEFIRKETKADNSELFLAEHEEGDLVLSVCRGKDRNRLMTKIRFERGIGYPGIVVKTGKPLISRNVQDDPRYLRKAVKECGVRSYISVPLLNFGDGPDGALLLSWHQPDVPLENISKLLQRVAIPVSNTLYAGIHKTRMSLRAELLLGKKDKSKNWLQNLLQTVQNRAGARGGAVFLLDNAKTRVIMTETSGSMPPVCNDIKTSDCPYLTNHQGVVIKGPCDNMPRGREKQTNKQNVFCCAPIYTNGHLFGRILLDYGNEVGEPATQELVSLIAMGQEAGLYIPTHAPEIGAIEKNNSAIESSIELRCLGGFEVLRDGQPIPRSSFVRSKALTLLKILILKGGRAIHKDTLIEMLWPEVGFETGSNRLHGVVHALRAAIEPNFKDQQWFFIKSEGDRYYFNINSCHKVDFFEFCKLLDDAFKRVGKAPNGEVLDSIEKAIDLYKGDLFGSEGCEDFFEADRENLRQLYLEAVERSVQMRFDLNEYDKPAVLLRHALRIDPLRESLHQSLIKALVKLGRRMEAKEQYQYCVNILRGELGVEPLAETLQLGTLFTTPPNTHQIAVSPL